MNTMSMTNVKKFNSIGLFLICYFILYYDTILGLIENWNANDNYSHGFLVPFITLYFIWNLKDQLSNITIKPDNNGLFFLIGSLIFFIITNIGAELFTMRFTMILVLLSGIYYLLGIDFMRRLFLPVSYLIFMIPFPAIIWNKIAFPLKIFATSIAVSVIKFINIPVYSEGNIIHLANTTLEVVDACSGLRSLVSLLALSAAFALITKNTRIRNVILFLSAIPIAIILNIFRLTMTAVLAMKFGPDTAKGFLHDASGFVVFIMAFLLLMMVNNALSKSERMQVN